MRDTVPGSGNNIAGKKERLTKNHFLKRSIGTVGLPVLYSNGFGSLTRHHSFAGPGFRQIYMVLIYWSPDINIVHDPRRFLRRNRYENIYGD